MNHTVNFSNDSPVSQLMNKFLKIILNVANERSSIIV